MRAGIGIAIGITTVVAFGNSIVMFGGAVSADGGHESIGDTWLY